MYCNQCGFENSDTSKFCSNCGSSLETQVCESEDNQIMRNNPAEKSKLFGFRSGKIWKKILAVMYFIGAILLLIAVFTTNDDCDFTAKDKILTKISYFFVFIAYVLPYIWLSDLLPLKVKLMKNKKKGLVVLIAVLLAVIPLFVSGVSNEFKSEDYQTAYAQKQEEERIKAEEIQKQKELEKSSVEAEKAKTTEYVTEQKSIVENTTTKEKPTKKKKQTTTEKTTVDALRDNMVDANEETMLIMMCEDIGKRLSNYPATVKFDTMSWTFEQNGLKYTTCSTFECQNAYGVKETHILVVIAEADSDGSKINPTEVCVDGKTVSIY